MTLQLDPIGLRAANAFVFQHHRHSKPVRGQKFSVAVLDVLLGSTCIAGVAIAGRPVSRVLDDGYIIEILRVCTIEGHRNACSMLYGACCNAAKALGYHRAVTYTLDRERGASLRAAGFIRVDVVNDRQWDCQSRPRAERDLIGDKVRWERQLR